MDMKRNYYEDVRLFSSGVAVFWFVFLLLFLLMYPFLFKNYYVYVANYIAINIIVVVGLNLLVGFTGQISLGHAGFFAIGAYGTITLMTLANFPFFPALVAAGLIAGCFGFSLGIPALRLEGPYLAIATLGFGLTITTIIGRIGILGGRQGLHAPDLVVFGYQLETDRQFYYLAMIIMVVLVIFARNITRTRVGRAFIAIRDAHVAAETMGVNILLYKTMAFALSAFYAGIAGGLYAFVLRFIEPELFSLFLSVMFLTMAVAGGLGSTMGPIAGAIVLSYLDLQLRNILGVAYIGELLRYLSTSYFSLTGVSNIQFIIFGGILILIMLFEPLGLYGLWIRIKKYWRTWPF